MIVVVVHFALGAILVMVGGLQVGYRNELAGRARGRRPRSSVAHPNVWAVAGVALTIAGILQLLAGFTQLSNGS